MTGVQTCALPILLKPDGVIVVTSPAPEFAVSALVADHYARVKNIWGVHRKASTVLTSTGVFLVSGVAQWALNNLVINGREASGEYHSLDHAEMERLLSCRHGQGLARFDVARALADQNIFATAVKAAVA